MISKSFDVHFYCVNVVVCVA